VSVLDRFRRWVWRVEERSNELEYRALDTVHDVEDELDERTHGRFYDTVEKVDEGSEELLERLHLDDEDDEVDENASRGQSPGV
jgi:hypothetical protein